MFDPTSRLAALGMFATLAFACDLDDDDEPQRPVTDSNASDEGAVDDGDDDDDDDSAGEESGEDDDGDDDDGAADDGGGAEFGFCVHACEEADDCCYEGVECGTYPNAWECNAGACAPLGCTGDGDCIYIENTTCQEAGGMAQCVKICEADADCIVDLGETCAGVTDGGQGFCVIPAPQCASDEECNANAESSFVCTDGMCLCDGDEDCAGIGESCDLDTGLCHCTGNATCPDGFACA